MAEVGGDYDAFVGLALRLRAEGATRVRDGGLEVAWAEPPAVETPPAERHVVALGESEREEFERLRYEAALAEELP